MRVYLLLASIVIVAACGDKTVTPPTGSKNKTVEIVSSGDAYSPTFATLSVGDTVLWNFNRGSGNMGHNVRFTPRITGAPADIPIIPTGTATTATARSVFTTKGTFNYVCDVHPGMIGSVTVQ